MLHQQIDQKISEKEAWALRRQLGIPNNKRWWVLACMDERLPVEKALGITEGDAYISVLINVWPKGKHCEKFASSCTPGSLKF